MKIPEEVIRLRMLRIGKQYIADLSIMDIADMMEEYVEQFKISSNPVLSDSFSASDMVEFAKFVRPYEITDDTLEKWQKNFR